MHFGMAIKQNFLLFALPYKYSRKVSHPWYRGAGGAVLRLQAPPHGSLHKAAGRLRARMFSNILSGFSKLRNCVTRMHRSTELQNQVESSRKNSIHLLHTGTLVCSDTSSHNERAQLWSNKRDGEQGVVKSVGSWELIVKFLTRVRISLCMWTRQEWAAIYRRRKNSTRYKRTLTSR
jgi:hypothetical protein